MTPAWPPRPFSACVEPIARAGHVPSRSAGALADACGSARSRVIDALAHHPPMYQEASAAHLLPAGGGFVMPGFVARRLRTGTRARATDPPLGLRSFSPGT